ncbi:MAG: protoporphyrinogen oxidase HemJ [Alphaproteobacteria bacterium]
MYLWIKALHVVAVIAWMAGMLYLPRLYVYHAEAAPGSDRIEIFKIMERRLLRYIVNPAMIAAMIFGFWMLALDPGILHQGWMHVKLTLVIAMTALHGMFARWRRDFAEGRNKKSPRFYRIVNEAVTLLMIGIVIMAVVKPF